MSISLDKLIKNEMQVAVVLYRQQKNNNPRRKSIFTWREREGSSSWFSTRGAESGGSASVLEVYTVEMGTLVVAAAAAVCLLACLLAEEAIRRGSEAIILTSIGLTLIVSWH